MTPQQFLDLVHGPDALIYFQVGGRTWKNKPQTYQQAHKTLCWRNHERDDICFIVNSGGTKDAEITRINSVFLDWDCGRDENGCYFCEEFVLGKKELFLPQLRSFALSTSILVETRNGFHAYWLVESGVTHEQFRDCQKRLAIKFGGDGRVTNPARVMRLPGFDWVKPGSGCAPFHVRVLCGTGLRYPVNMLLEALADVELPATVEQKGRICAHNKCECITTLALIVGAKPANQEIVLPSVVEAIRYLKQQDLANYLNLTIGTTTTTGVDQVISCPFHNDMRSSAGIYRARGMGDWLFKCHACGTAGSIIDLTMKIYSCDQAGAMAILYKQYNITILPNVTTDWKLRQQNILRRNMAIIDDVGALQSSYPCLYRLIWRVKDDLIAKLRLAYEMVRHERHQHEGQAVFFASLRHFHRVVRGLREPARWCNRQNEKVDRYCLLGLLTKLSDSQVPPALLKEARAYQESARHAYRIQFYTILEYAGEVLEKANYRACKLVESGMSVRGISFESITALFGEALAAEVFPQRQREHGQRSPSAAFGESVEEAVVSAIADKGYTTLAELRSVMAQDGEWPSVTERRIQRCLPSVLAKHGLRKATCNGELKQRLEIVQPGYPKIIVSEERLA